MNKLIRKITIAVSERDDCGRLTTPTTASPTPPDRSWADSSEVSSEYSDAGRIAGIIIGVLFLAAFIIGPICALAVCGRCKMSSAQTSGRAQSNHVTTYPVQQYAQYPHVGHDSVTVSLGDSSLQTQQHALADAPPSYVECMAKPISDNQYLPSPPAYENLGFGDKTESGVNPGT